VHFQHRRHGSPAPKPAMITRGASSSGTGSSSSGFDRRDRGEASGQAWRRVQQRDRQHVSAVSNSAKRARSGPTRCNEAAETKR